MAVKSIFVGFAYDSGLTVWQRRGAVGSRGVN